MNGRTPTAAEKKWMDTVATYGCYCCRRMGIANGWISIHHTDGRTKPYAHFKVIPLCDKHHEYNHPTGFHANAGKWRKAWGRESEILAELYAEFYNPIERQLQRELYQSARQTKKAVESIGKSF